MIDRGPVILGPVVGHTDEHSTRIWIRVNDDPSRYTLRIAGKVFPFESTEDAIEFGTAIAIADGLRADSSYRYQVLNMDRVVPTGSGSFRTMPLPGSFADVLFVSLSCSHRSDPGAWALLSRYINQAHPRFIVMMGDQVYLDSGDNDVWSRHLSSPSPIRRKAMADKYQEHWSREPIRTILANTPIYMMWDDHDIRNGWGSFAPDSPSLAALYSKGAWIADLYSGYFNDARDLFWHFQMSHNPLPPASLPPPGIGQPRRAMPFFFQCGRLLVIVVDDRGDRDIWRSTKPVLGQDQWDFLHQVLDNLASEIDAIALIVPLPLTSMSPKGVAQTLFGRRTDDVQLFREGRAEELLALLDKEAPFWELPITAAGAAVSEGSPVAVNWGNFKISLLTDVRDNWAHRLSQPEQRSLIRIVGEAAARGRPRSHPRTVLFIGGDLHVGGVYSVSVDKPRLNAPSLVTSGISKTTAKTEGVVGLMMDTDYELGQGMRAKLKHFVRVYNFGVTQMVFDGQQAKMANALAHTRDNTYLRLRLGT